jgi:hypothetical protein
MVAQVILRYTAEGSTIRNDMQIGPLSLDSMYTPPDGMGTGINATGKSMLLGVELPEVATDLPPRVWHATEH